MACRTLQVVGHGPVKLVTQCFFYHVGNDRCYATQLGMAECVAGALLGEEATVGVTRTLRDHDRAVSVGIDLLLDRGDELVVIEIYLGK